MTKKKYNHSFGITFSISDSKYEDWEECIEKEKDKIVLAMWERVVSLFSNEEEYLGAIEGYDTYEQTTYEEDFNEDETTSDLAEE